METRALAVEKQKIEVDPVTFSVLTSKLKAVSTQMSLTVLRTARTTIINSARDFSCSLFDPQMRLLIQEDALPIQTVASGNVIKAIAQFFGDDIHPGDVMMHNAPYWGGSHVGDVTVASPVFYEGRLIFWVLNRAHLVDLGACEPASVSPFFRDVFEEGLHVPPLRICRDYKEIKDVLNFFLTNVRYADLVYGDLSAQLGSLWVAEQNLLDLCKRYGADFILQFLNDYVDYADRMASQEINSWPDGTAVGEDHSDGVHGVNEDVKVRATVTIEGDMITVDLNGSTEQLACGINSTVSNSHAAVGQALLVMLDPAIPRNEGCLKHFRTIAPEGTITNPRWPASTSMATVGIASTISNAVWKAMARLVPERAPAGTGKMAALEIVHGIDPRTNKMYSHLPFTTLAGAGGLKGYDGYPFVYDPAVQGSMEQVMVEIDELELPRLILYREIETDSAGAGQWRGGVGCSAKYKPRGGKMQILGLSDGHRFAPHGVLGGLPGSGSKHYVINERTGERKDYRGYDRMVLDVDDLHISYATGGGGYGDPLDRDPELVREDAREEIVSLQAAREVYGVVLNTEPELYEVDHAATKKLRAELKARKKGGR